MEARQISFELRDYLAECGAGGFDRCMQCGLCTGVCPWRLVPGETSERFNIRRMLRLGQLGLEGFEEELVLFACSTCSMCRTYCPRGVEIVDVVRGMRATMVGAEMIPAGLRSVLGSCYANGNPWGGPREKRTEWQAGCDVPEYGPTTEYLLFVCCHSCYDPRSTRIARSVVQLLQHLGVSFGVIGVEESCCAESLRKLGDEELFQKLARANIELFQRRGVKKIITTSPHCLWTFRNEYPELGGGWEVVHYTELLSRSVAGSGLAFSSPSGKKVAYHDPCYLGRQSGIYQAPRDLLQALTGGDVLELELAAKQSLCCAGGGGRIWAEVPMGERFAELRVLDAVAKGAKVLTTACPYCVNMLTDACKTLEKQEILEILELSEMLADGLP